MKAIVCRNCGAGIDAGSIDNSLGLATCSHCGTLHDLPRAPINDSSDSAGKTAPAKPERVEVALPEKFNIHRGSDGLQITWPVGGLFPGLVLLVIAGGFAYVAMTSGMLLLLIPVVAIVYFAATRAFNKHRIRVDKSQLHVTQGPLPWAGNQRVPSSQITQLYTTEHKTRAQPQGDDKHDQKVQISIYYRLIAKTKDNKHITILNGLNDPLQALWLEQEIEKLLGISDGRVSGEYYQ